MDEAGPIGLVPSYDVIILLVGLMAGLTRFHPRRSQLNHLVMEPALTSPVPGPLSETLILKKKKNLNYKGETGVEKNNGENWEPARSHND